MYLMILNKFLFGYWIKFDVIIGTTYFPQYSMGNIFRERKFVSNFPSCYCRELKNSIIQKLLSHKYFKENRSVIV